MTNAELNTFLDLEWNCAAFTPEKNIRFSALIPAPVGTHHLPTPGASGVLSILRVHPQRMDHCS